MPAQTEKPPQRLTVGERIQRLWALFNFRRGFPIPGRVRDVAYWRLFYHFVWTTKSREPLLTPNIETNVYRFLHAEANKMYVPLFVIGGIEDHAHVLAAVRPSVSPADFIHQLKGSSSRFVTQEFKRPFEWQEGYGVFSVSEDDVPDVIRYIENQK